MAIETSGVIVAPNLAAERGSQSQHARHGTQLEWSAILGGTVVSAAITTALATFGSALGLSMVSADLDRASSLTALAVAFGLWALWVTVSACGAGGYIAGRMRRPILDVGQDEARLRDGMHGLVVWAAGALLVAMLASSAVVNAARTVIGGATAAASGAASLVATQADPLARALDGVMRGNGAETVSPEERDEASRILTRSLAGDGLAQPDRDYLTGRMAARLNIPQPQAEQRLNEAYSRLNEARETAVQAAERARRVAILSAFATAAALLAGAAAAWLAAQLGGRHRDEQLGVAQRLVGGT